MYRGASIGRGADVGGDASLKSGRPALLGWRAADALT